MKAFARRTPKNRTAPVDADQPSHLLGLDELDVAPLGVATPDPAALEARPAPGVAAPGAAGHGVDEEATREAEVFAERLGDLDRFIGSGGAAPTPTTGATPPVMWSPTVSARNLRAAPTGALAPISHPRPRPASPSLDGAANDEAAAAVEPSSYTDPTGDDFVERLGDLDRFIGGAVTPPTSPATVQPAVEPDDEAQDFLDRLGDLDRFIGGDSSPQ